MRLAYVAAVGSYGNFVRLSACGCVDDSVRAILFRRTIEYCAIIAVAECMENPD